MMTREERREAVRRAEIRIFGSEETPGARAAGIAATAHRIEWLIREGRAAGITAQLCEEIRRSADAAEGGV